ncbi:MAG: hypothetical protein H5U04_02680 [Firmicutes bacterium]|nr:hypothetical protein [Bacillota bacterium]
MKVIGDDLVVYALSPENAPVAVAEPGEEVVFETRNCFSSQILPERDLFASVGWATINPATGPWRWRAQSRGTPWWWISFAWRWLPGA